MLLWEEDYLNYLCCGDKDQDLDNMVSETVHSKLIQFVSIDQD